MNWPAITPEQIELVQRTFAQLAPINGLAADLFQEELFVLGPEIKTLFGTDAEAHKQIFMQTLQCAVHDLALSGVTCSALENLGRWHERYGVQQIHYRTMQEALLWMLRQTLGDAFNAETRSAWTHTFSVLARVMKEAAATERLALTLL